MVQAAALPAFGQVARSILAGLFQHFLTVQRTVNPARFTALLSVASVVAATFCPHLLGMACPIAAFPCSFEVGHGFLRVCSSNDAAASRAARAIQ